MLTSAELDEMMLNARAEAKLMMDAFNRAYLKGASPEYGSFEQARREVEQAIPPTPPVAPIPPIGGGFNG